MKLHEKFPISETISSPEKWQEVILETIAHFKKIKWLEQREKDGFNIVTGGPWKIAVKNGYLFSLPSEKEDKLLLETSELLLLHRHQQNLRKVLVEFPAEIKDYLIEKLDPKEEQFSFKRSELNHGNSSKSIKKAAATIRCMTFGKSIKSRQTASLVVWRLIAKHIDHKIFSKTLSLHGYYSSFHEYNLLLANKDEVERLSESTPSIVSAWLSIKNKDKVKNVTTYTGHEVDEYIKNLKSTGIVAEVKEYLKNKNAYSGKNWKYICKLKPRWAKFLFGVTKFNIGDAGDRIEDLFNLLTVIRVIPRLKIYKRFILFYISNLSQHPNLPIEDFHIFAQRYFERSYREKVATFWYQTMMPAMDWWISLGREFRLTNTQRKSNWKWFHKKQLEWHEEFRANNVNTNHIEIGKIYEWDSSIKNELIIDKYKIIPLTNSNMLSEEGSLMSHCVSGYDFYCYNGTSRIFAIVNNNTRVATLELKITYPGNFIRNKNGKIKWTVSQVKGFHNEQVEPDVNKISAKIANIYTEEFLKIPHSKGKIIGDKQTPDKNNMDELLERVENIEVARNGIRGFNLNGLEYANIQNNIAI